MFEGTGSNHAAPLEPAFRGALTVCGYLEPFNTPQCSRIVALALHDRGRLHKLFRNPHDPIVGRLPTVVGGWEKEP